MPSEASTSKALFAPHDIGKLNIGRPAAGGNSGGLWELHAEPRMRLRRPSSACLLALRRQSAAEEAVFGLDHFTHGRAR
jgi:hypothetical protein